MEIVIGLYIVGIVLTMEYLINRYPEEKMAIIFLVIIITLQILQKYFQ